MQEFASCIYRMTTRKVMAVVALAITLSGCTAHPPVIEKRDGYFVDHSFNAVAQDQRVRFLVMHYTALDDDKSLRVLTQNQVSAHYLVPTVPRLKDGQPLLLQLVDEKKRAWHAGVSNWNGRNNLNDSSVGIEIVNTGYTADQSGFRTWYPYTEEQIAAIATMAKDIINRYNITPDNVVAHSDIAPLRKQDPGPFFPWERLAQMGIGAWPDQTAVTRFLAGRVPYAPANVKDVQALLKQYGYDQIPQNGVLDDETQKTISAFQMHFRPSDISGNADAETESIARALVEKYRSSGRH